MEIFLIFGRSSGGISCFLEVCIFRRCSRILADILGLLKVSGFFYVFLTLPGFSGVQGVTTLCPQNVNRSGIVTRKTACFENKTVAYYNITVFLSVLL